MSSPRRNALIDSAKALACAAIVLHHLSFYGPMPELVRQVAPGLIAGLVEYARMAVQVFLVLGGYLAAASLAPQGVARCADPLAQLGQRFMRLFVPYAVALVLVMAVSAAVRPWWDDPAVPADPDMAQLLAHALLLQGVLGEESLSAGIWYVAIDLQLYALTLLLFAALRRWAVPAWRVPLGQVLVLLLVAASLLLFNRDARWDDWALYFFGTYGLGMMACWAVRAEPAQARRWLAVMALLLLAALLLDWRARIALAGVTALALVLLLRWPALQAWQGWPGLSWLGQVSYSVFLLHFALCLLVNALLQQFWPGSVPAALLGMVAGFVLSLAAGGWLYRRVECHRPTWRTALRWQAGLVGAGLMLATVLR